MANFAKRSLYGSEVASIWYSFGILENLFLMMLQKIPHISPKFQYTFCLFL